MSLETSGKTTLRDVKHGQAAKVLKLYGEGSNKEKNHVWESPRRFW